MKTTPYVKLEKEIASADRGGIRKRWLYGLRLLRDPEAMAPSGKSLRHGVTEKLIAAAQAASEKLSSTEIRYRLQCARAYPTETQIANIVGDFKAWRDLIQAGFPAYEAPEGEPPADHRNDAERDHDRARALGDLLDDQDSLVPLRIFEPVTTTL